MNNINNTPTSINDLEGAVLAGNYDLAGQHIVSIIRLYEKSQIALNLAPFNRTLSVEQAELESYQVIEKLAFTLTIWFSDPNWQPEPELFGYLAMQKKFFGCVFAASSYHSTDHIVQNLGILGKQDYTPEQIKRILLLFTLESDIELPWQALFTHLPNETAQAITGLVYSIGLQLSQRAQKTISQLLNAVKLLPTLESGNIEHYGPLLRAFFNCSSLADDNRYNLKDWIAKSIQLYVQNNITPKYKKQLKTDVKSRVFRQEQTILFIHEHYKSDHAMYRSWHASFQSIKGKYKTVSLSMNSGIDPVSGQDFDRVITVDEEWNIDAFIKHVLTIKPDVIIYPSIGMSAFAPFLAAMRLAPMQIALPGHPSSSYMPTIDYFIVSREGLSDQDMANILTETWVECIDGPGQITTPAKSKEIKKVETQEFCIAVNGVIQKVSHQLIQSCVRISQQSKQQVTFVFFMAHSKQYIEYFAVKSMLRRFLPNSIIYPYSDYATYLERLSRCKFAIPTVPFGGSNSNIDLVELGIPKLFMKHHEDLSGTSDMQIWQALGVTDGFCSTIEELEKRAIELVEQPSKLAELTSKIEQINISALDLSVVTEPEQTRFFKTLSSLIESCTEKRKY